MASFKKKKRKRKEKKPPQLQCTGGVLKFIQYRFIHTAAKQAIKDVVGAESALGKAGGSGRGWWCCCLIKVRKGGIKLQQHVQRFKK